MAKAAAKKKAGRPRIEIDERLLKTLSGLQCTIDEICQGLRSADENLKIDVRTLKRRLMEPHYRAIWEAGKTEGRVSLRRLQWRSANGIFKSGAQAGTATPAAVNMQLHLSKHILGQTDKSLLELSGKVDSTVELTSARERVTRKFDALSERITRRVAGLAVSAGAQQVPGEPVRN